MYARRRDGLRLAEPPRAREAHFVYNQQRLLKSCTDSSYLCCRALQPRRRPVSHLLPHARPDMSSLAIPPPLNETRERNPFHFRFTI